MITILFSYYKDRYYRCSTRYFMVLCWNSSFKIPSLSNIVASGIVLSVVVIFVKDQSDLSLYVFTIAIVTVLNQLPLFIYLKRCISFVSVNWIHVWQLFRSSLAYLLPMIPTYILVFLALFLV